MGTAAAVDDTAASPNGVAETLPPQHSRHHHDARVAAPPDQPFVKSFGNTVKETLFPDDPFRQFKNQPKSRKVVLGLQYFFTFLEWAPTYTFGFLKADLVAGVTVASLAIPQGISYAKLAGLPPILGLYSSFVPPLVYAMMGSSKHVAIGNVAVGSILFASSLGQAVTPLEDPELYLHLALTATFFAGVFQAALGLLRLGFVVDFLSHATIVGFTAGAATVVSLQQLKGIMGLKHFTHSTDVVSVMRSIFSQRHDWIWETAVLGSFFILFLLGARYFSKKKPKYFWVSAVAPLTAVVFGSLFVFFTHADKHGVAVIGDLKKGLNPPSVSELTFNSPYISTVVKTGILSGIIVLAEGIAAGRSFAMLKNYNIDGNKEMVAYGFMNIVGSFTTCYVTSGPFSRSAVNYNAGCQTAVSNIVMAVTVMITLLFLTPLLHYTPLVVLSSIIISAMLGLIDYSAAIHLWKVDKFDFVVCVGAFFGVVFGNIELGLIIAVSLSVLRILLAVARPKTLVLGKVPGSECYRSVDQYPSARTTPGLLVLEIDAPIYFANSSYLRERIMRWIDEEEDRVQSAREGKLQYVILNMGAVGSMDTSGIGMLSELKKMVDKRGLKLVLANPRGEVMKKLERSRLIVDSSVKDDTMMIHLTVEGAVAACRDLMLYHKMNWLGGDVESGQ